MTSLVKIIGLRSRMGLLDLTLSKGQHTLGPSLILDRRIFHHSTYRVLLGHKERKILSSLWVKENRFKQWVWIQGTRPEEEEIFEFTMVQGVGGSWDGYWLTESLLHDGDGFAGGLAY